MKIYNLKRDELFTCPDIPTLGKLRFLGMDGMYAQVQALDEDINKLHADAYSAGCNFFVLHCGTEVHRHE